MTELNVRWVSRYSVSIASSVEVKATVSTMMYGDPQQQQHGGDFHRGPPPPMMMRQPSASSTNLPQDYHHPPGPPMPYEGTVPHSFEFQQFSRVLWFSNRHWEFWCFSSLLMCQWAVMRWNIVSEPSWSDIVGLLIDDNCEREMSDCWK